MNIFIETYHLVKKIIDLPKKIADDYKAKQVAEELKKEQEERSKRLIAETMGTVSSVEQAHASIEAKKEDKSNLFTFNYIVKDSSGKQIKGSFDAKRDAQLIYTTIRENDDGNIIVTLLECRFPSQREEIRENQKDNRNYYFSYCYVNNFNQ